jgi:hypothetical protein
VASGIEIDFTIECREPRGVGQMRRDSHAYDGNSSRARSEHGDRVAAGISIVALAIRGEGMHHDDRIGRVARRPGAPHRVTGDVGAEPQALAIQRRLRPAANDGQR